MMYEVNIKTIMNDLCNDGLARIEIVFKTYICCLERRLDFSDNDKN